MVEAKDTPDCNSEAPKPGIENGRLGNYLGLVPRCDPRSKPQIERYFIGLSTELLCIQFGPKMHQSVRKDDENQQ